MATLSLPEALLCPTCKGRGEVAPAVVTKGIKSVVCPTCRGYGAPKPTPVVVPATPRPK